MATPGERLTAEWHLAPAAALADLPHTGMVIMRWTYRMALRREFVSRVCTDPHSVAEAEGRLRDDERRGELR